MEEGQLVWKECISLCRDWDELLTKEESNTLNHRSLNMLRTYMNTLCEVVSQFHFMDDQKEVVLAEREMEVARTLLTLVS